MERRKTGFTRGHPLHDLYIFQFNSNLVIVDRQTYKKKHKKEENAPCLHHDDGNRASSDIGKQRAVSRQVTC